MCSETFVIDILNQIILAQDILIFFFQWHGYATSPLWPAGAGGRLSGVGCASSRGSSTRSTQREPCRFQTGKGSLLCGDKGNRRSRSWPRHFSVPAVWCVDPQLVRIVLPRIFRCPVPQLWRGAASLSRLCSGRSFLECFPSCTWCRSTTRRGHRGLRLWRCWWSMAIVPGADPDPSIDPPARGRAIGPRPPVVGERGTPPALKPACHRWTRNFLDLVKQKPGVLLQFLSATGVETFADLRGVWTSSTEFVTEVESFIQEKLEPDVAMQLATFWTLSSRRATEFQKRLTKNLVMERESAYRSPGLTLREAQSSSSAVLPRVKRLIAEGSAGPPVTTVKLAASDAEVKETVAIQTKIDAIFQLALEEVVNLQDLGVTWTELEDPLVLQSTKDTMMANASRLSLGRLSALLAAFRRWRRYAAEHGLSVRSPTPMQLASFLRQVGQGGPTAASSQFLAMLWWQKALGADFPMDHWLVAPWRLHAANHQGSQATELAPWEFLNLLRWASVLQGTHQLLVSFLLMIAVSCVRFEHIQRSKYIQRHDGWLEFFCRKGKARKQGSRPGFGWCLPDVRWQGFSLCNPCWLLQEWGPVRALFDTISWPPTRRFVGNHFYNPVVLNKAMSRGRFLEILRGSLMQINVDPTSASRAQYNRLRRFLPTGGNMEPFDQQALGNWTEIPSGAGASGQKARAQMHGHALCWR